MGELYGVVISADILNESFQILTGTSKDTKDIINVSLEEDRGGFGVMFE